MCSSYCVLFSYSALPMDEQAELIGEQNDLDIEDESEGSDAEEDIKSDKVNRQGFSYKGY